MQRDFAALAARLLQQSRSLLPAWFPAGRWNGHEYTLGNLQGEPGDSLSINSNNGKWSDFASGEKGGDLLALYAAAHGMKQSEAYDALDGSIGTAIVGQAKPKPERQRRNVVMPVPEGVTACACRHYKFGKPSRVWNYHDAEARLLGHVARYDLPEGKQVVPWSYADGKWGMGAFPAPRPLYGLAELAARPDAPVIVVEGEKAADACRTLAPQYVVVTWPGGSQAWRKATFAALRGRPSVLLWPDADDPGIRCMWEIGHALLKLVAVVKIIIPDSVSDGFDAADAVAEGWDWQRLKSWALPRVKLIDESTSTTGGNHGSDGTKDRPNGQAGEGARGSQVNGHDREGGDRRVDEGGAGTSGGAHVAGRRGNGVANQARDTQPDDAAEPVGDHESPPLAAYGQAHGDGDREPGADPRDEDGPRSAQQDARRHAAGAGGDGGRAGRSGDEAHVPATQAEAPQSQVARWLAWGMDRNGNGLPFSNLNNVVIVLERDPALRGLVWYDEFLQRLMTGTPAREWTDADDANLTLYMQREVGVSKMGSQPVAQGVQIVAFRHPRNCVRDWLDTLTHDGIERIEHFFPDSFGSEDTAYTRAAGRNFWLSMVARVYKPGCKVDNMIVLEGAQGVGKSTALQIIGGEWFAEQHESATNPKAFAEILQGKLLIEISEMDAFSRAEVNRVKQVITCPSDRYRASYAHYAADHPRQGVFVGTTNKDDWNRDETGARRFWPIQCGEEVNLEGIRQGRDQLFAEAVKLIKAGKPWHVMPGEETREEQRSRYVDDPWTEAIASYLLGRSEATVNDVIAGALSKEVGDINRADQMRVAACMRVLGWVKPKRGGGNRRIGKHVVKVWLRGEKAGEISRPQFSDATEATRNDEIPF